jgi:hypothetical protein
MPATLNTFEAAEMLGVDPQILRVQRGTGKLPVEPLTLGSRFRWPTSKIADALGIPWSVVGADDARSLPEGDDDHAAGVGSGAQPETTP